MGASCSSNQASGSRWPTGVLRPARRTRRGAARARQGRGATVADRRDLGANVVALRPDTFAAAYRRSPTGTRMGPQSRPWAQAEACARHPGPHRSQPLISPHSSPSSPARQARILHSLGRDRHAGRRPVDAAVNQAQLPLAGRSAVVTGAGGGIGRWRPRARARAGGAPTRSSPHAARRPGSRSHQRSGRLAGRRSACVPTSPIAATSTPPSASLGRRSADSTSRCTTRSGAGRSRRDARIQHLPLESISELTATTTTATLHCAQAAFADLRRSRGRYIVVSSTAGLRGNPVLPVYSIVKAAQRGMAKALAWEWAPHGITVNIVNPVARTDAVDALIEREPGGRGAHAVPDPPRLHR